jgi:hypothetical protein
MFSITFNALAFIFYIGYLSVSNTNTACISKNCLHLSKPGWAHKAGISPANFYLTEIVSVDTEDESVTVDVESVLEVAFSVEDSLDPQDVKAKAITSAKIERFFIFNCIMFVDSLTYIDLRFESFIYPSC